MNEEDCEQDRATQVGGGDAEKERGQDVCGCAREKVCTLIHATEAATNDDEDFLKSALCMVHHLVMAFYSLSLSLSRSLSLSLSPSLPLSYVSRAVCHDNVQNATVISIDLQEHPS